jgi:hypothetical protein
LRSGVGIEILFAMSDTPPAKVSFLSCWLKATGILYLLYATLGFLADGIHGLAVQLGAGIIRAPLLGLVAGLIWWLARR